MNGYRVPHIHSPFIPSMVTAYPIDHNHNGRKPLRSKVSRQLKVY